MPSTSRLQPPACGLAHRAEKLPCPGAAALRWPAMYEGPISTPRALESCVDALRRARGVHLDTEFDAMRGGATLCLLQLSDGERTFVIDPLAVDIAPLREILGAPGVEWVVHAGRQDVALLREKLRIQAPDRLFDTQIAWALLTPEAGVGLAYLEHRVLGVMPAKGHQVDDWKRRPLGASQLAYAARDVAHLPALREHLGARLEALGRLDMVYQASREALGPAPEAAPLTLASFRNAWQLDPTSQAALLALLGWANALTPAEAAALLPEGKILLAMAARLPATTEVLGQMKGVPRRLVTERGAEVVALLQGAASRAKAGDFIPLAPQPYATHEGIWARARLELLRAHASRLLEVAPELLLPNRQLERMSAALVTSGDLDALLDTTEGFRRQLLAPVWSEASRAI